MKDLYPEWLKHKSIKVKDTYVMRIKRSWKSYYADTSIISIPVAKLTKLELDEWAHKLIKEKALTKTEYYNLTVIMREALDYATDLGIVSSNVFRQVKVDGKRVFRRVHKKRPETQVFTSDEVKEICRLALDDFEHNGRLKYKLAPLLVAFALKVGQRPSELCAVKYSDIEGGRLHVQRMLEIETGRVRDSFKGTYDAYEECCPPLSPEAIAIMELCRKTQIELGVVANNYVFSLTDEIGRGLWESAENLLEKYSVQVGGVKRSLSKTRKTYISTAIDAGIHPDTVRRYVGHRDVRTTLNNYYFDRSSEEEQQRQIAEAFDRDLIFTNVE